MSLNVTHRFVSAKADSSDATIIQPSNWNAEHDVVDTSGILIAGDYHFDAQTPGGSLTSGITNTVTLTPVPDGVNGSNTSHYLYISNGTGTAEAVLITGGTAVSGATSGTVTFIPANNHSGSWTIQSATGGIKEALYSLATTGGIVRISANLTLRANVIAVNALGVVVQRLPGVTISGSFTIFGASYNSPTYAQIDYFHNNPNFATLDKIYNGVRHVIGDYPLAEEAGQQQFGVIQAVVGAVALPAGNGSLHNCGVSGYAKNSATTGAAVGIFGQGEAAVDSCGVWGANFCGNNFVGAAGAGKAANVWGIEVDLNISGTGSAPVNAWGITIVGAAYQQGSSQYDGVRVQRAIPSQVKFKNGFISQDGASEIAFAAGAGHESTSSSSSQTLKFYMRDSGGSTHAATIYLNYSNYLTLLAGGYDFQNELGTSFFTVDAVSVRTSNNIQLLKAGVVLSNGANSDINIGASGKIRITGPTGAFSVTGFTGGADGRLLYLLNTTSQVMTITNDATSTAANRIYTLTGANVVLRAGTSSAVFQYDTDWSRWVLVSTN